MVELAASALHLFVVFFHIIREDPRIGFALAILLIAGILVAILIRKSPRTDIPTLK